MLQLRTAHRAIALALLASLLVAVGPISPASANPTTYSATPSALSVGVTLGQVASVDLTINTGGSAAVRVYEGTPPKQLARQLDNQTPFRVPLPQQAERIDPALLAGATARDNRAGGLMFTVFLSDQADLAPAFAIRNWNERGHWVYATLRDHAARTQADLLNQLAAAGLDYTPLWIVNAVVVRGATPQIVTALAARSDVALLRANRVYTLNEPAQIDANRAACNADASGMCWPLRALNVPRAWAEWATRGAGVTVATIDSGALYAHPALEQQYRGYRGSKQFDHNYNWFDPDAKHREPVDVNGHGTHVLGSIVGRGDGSTQSPIFGVAPEARWITAQGCDGRSCEEDDLLMAAQWLLAPTNLDNKSPRPDLRPQIVSNSWGDSSRQNNNWFTGYANAWRAAGILPFFAAGNRERADCASVDSPGEYASVITVGATTPDGTIASFSSRGPAPNGQLKPDVVAPGEGILSTYRGTNGEPVLGVLSGTSMATPHAAGMAALLLGANPELSGDFDAVYELLTSSAQRVNNQGSAACGVGPDGTNQIYGYGLLDAASALAAIDVPWLNINTTRPAVSDGRARITVGFDARRVARPGNYAAQLLINGGNASQPPTIVPLTFTVYDAPGQQELRGQISDLERGVALRATVSVEYADGTTGPLLFNTSDYRIQLPPGEYRLAARGAGYVGETRHIVIGASPPVTQSFALRPDAPRMKLTTTQLTLDVAFGNRSERTLTITNTGTQPLSYTLSLPNNSYGVWRSDEEGGLTSVTTSWVELPPKAPNLAPLLKNDGAITQPVDLGFWFPLYDRVYTGTFVTENGLLTFFVPPARLALQRSCPPATEQIFMLLMPFKADLDFAKGGRLRHGPNPSGRGYVFSYEEVPLKSGSATYSFQTVLYPDGTVVYNYRDVTPLPPRVGVGIQRSPTMFQIVTCGSEARLSDGLSLVLRPQPSEEGWLRLPAPSGTVRPGGSVTVPFEVGWLYSPENTTYRGSLTLSTNDPTQLNTAITVPLRPLRAPNNIALFLVGRGR